VWSQIDPRARFGRRRLISRSKGEEGRKMNRLILRSRRKIEEIRNSRRKRAYQALTNSGRTPTPLFVVGCQRSGTNMLHSVLDKSVDTLIYNEDNRRAFRNYRIKPLKERMGLLDQARCSWVVFKPLCDSQNIDRLLADHSDGKAIWMFRSYQDVANSAVRKWDGLQRSLIRDLATSEKCSHWLAERVGEERRQLVKHLYRDDISVHSAAALKWYLRNEIYFDYELDRNPDRILLLKYDDLVLDPAKAFARVFGFLEIQIETQYVNHVFRTSIRKDPFPEIDPKIEYLCDEMMERLDRVLNTQNGHARHYAVTLEENATNALAS
jgi:hypothetical protein